MNRFSDLREVSAAPLPHLLSVPEATTTGGQPILCFLHGYDEGPPTALRKGMTTHGPLSPRASPLARSQFIIVAPQLPVRGDRWNRMATEITQLVGAVREEYSGDPARIYLTGFSFGANGVFDVALLRPEVWAALWPVDPTRVPAEDPVRPTWLSSGEISRRYEVDFVRRLHLEPLASAAPGDRVLLDYGKDHVGTATLAYEDERIYRWLLEKTLPGGEA